jgi:hypothetical protein
VADIELVDLEVIARYSLAIRQESAPAEEVLAALDESRAFVLAILDGATVEEADRRAALVAVVPDEDDEDEDEIDDVDEWDDDETDDVVEADETGEDEDEDDEVVEAEPVAEEPVPLSPAEAAARRAARRARREGRARS